MFGNYICFTTLPKINELLYVFATFNYGENIKISTYNHTIIKCRQLIFENNDVIAYPNLEGMYGIYIIVTETYYKTGALQEYLRKNNLKYNAPSVVSRNIYEECIFYTVLAKLAPKWNILSNYLVQGRNFLTSSAPIDCIHWQVFINSHGEATFNFKIGRIKMCSMSLEKLDLTGTLQNEFKTTGLIKFREGNYVTVRVLPSLKEGNILQISKQLKSVHFTDYQHMKRHWKNTYGYRLPDNETNIIYIDVSFFDGSPIFTYPSVCVRPFNPIFLQRIEPNSAITNFMTDLLKTVPKILGCSYPVPSHMSKPACGLSTASQITQLPNTCKTSLSPKSFHRKDIPATQNPAFLVIPNKPKPLIEKPKEISKEAALSNLIKELNREKSPSKIIITQTQRSECETETSQISTIKNQHYKPDFSKATKTYPEDESKKNFQKENINGYKPTFSKPFNGISQKLPQNEPPKYINESYPNPTTAKENSGSTNNTIYKPNFSKSSSTTNTIQKKFEQNKENTTEDNRSLYKPIFSKVSTTQRTITTLGKTEKLNSSTQNNTYKPIFSKTPQTFKQNIPRNGPQLTLNHEKYVTFEKPETLNSSTQNNTYKPIFSKTPHAFKQVMPQNEKQELPNPQKNNNTSQIGLYKPVFSKAPQKLNQNFSKNATQETTKSPIAETKNTEPFKPIFSTSNKTNTPQIPNVSNIKKNMALQMAFLTKSLEEKSSISPQKCASSDAKMTVTAPKFAPKFTPKVSKNVPFKPMTKVNKVQNKKLQIKKPVNAPKGKEIRPVQNNGKIVSGVNFPKTNIQPNIHLNHTNKITDNKIVHKENNNGTKNINDNKISQKENNMVSTKSNFPQPIKQNIAFSPSVSNQIPNENKLNIENKNTFKFVKNNLLSNFQTPSLNSTQNGIFSNDINLEKSAASQESQFSSQNYTAKSSSFAQNSVQNVAPKTLPTQNNEQKQKSTAIGSQKEQNKRPGADKKDNESSAPKKVKTKPVVQEISDSEMLDRMKNNTLDKLNVPNLVHWLKEKSIAVSSKDKKADLVAKVKFVLSVFED